MIRFTDPRLYVKGTCAAMLTDKSTGDIKYWSDKLSRRILTFRWSLRRRISLFGPRWLRWAAR